MATSGIAHKELLDKALLHRPSNDNREAIQSCQQALAHGKNVLTEFHLEGGLSAKLGKQHSWVIDQILLFIWEDFTKQFQGHPDLSLIAAGGYGRQELNLESDIDLLILLDPESAKEIDHFKATNIANPTSQLNEQFIQFCWDIGLQVGHTSGSVAQCIDLAKQDISVTTNLMETRLLAGSKALFAKLQTQLRSDKVWTAKKYFTLKLEEQEQRHKHFGDTAYNLEPNIKQSKGGLRDLHMISWVANRYFGTSDLAELVEHQFLSQAEYKALIKHRNFLWRMRNGLHCLSGRCEDRLLFDYQTELAKQLGYKQEENHLAVEQMMKQYYRTAKEMELLNEILLQHFQEAILTTKQPQVRKINHRFQSLGNYIEVTSPEVFAETPSALLEIFLILQKRANLVGVRASTVRLILIHVHRINHKFRNDPENRKLFLSIFKHQTGLTRILRKMSAYGVLGAFFPDFGRIVGQMQHDLFHIYTVDAHSLFVVENLRRLAREEYKEDFPNLTNILNQQNDRERLYLAALCHDIGKGSGRDHSEAGAEIAKKFCSQLGLSEYDANMVEWLVRHHLLMSWTAQKEDITDPRVVDRFAERVGDQEHLDNLYLLTFADMRGTSHKVWSDWKGRLLANLHAATSRRLRTGLSGAEAILERISARKKAIQTLVEQKIPADKLEAMWSQFGDEYFLRNGPGSSAWHAEVITSATVLDLPLVTARSRKEIGAHQVLIFAPESEELLTRVTAGMDRLNFNILDARIHSTSSNMSLLIFIASDPDSQSHNRKWVDSMCSELKTILLKRDYVYQPIQRMMPRAMKQFKLNTNVTFSDSPTESYTVMEVMSLDRPGLLFNVALALHECKVKLVSAKVSTVGAQAEDTFFITDRDGKPVTSEAKRKTLKQKLVKYLS